MPTLQQILTFLNKIEKLKTVKRAIQVSDNSRKESPAEHTWRVAVMAMIFQRKFNLKLDLLKTLEIILLHDVIEAEALDVWIEKGDTKGNQTKQEKEMIASKNIFWMLKNEKLEMRNEEYDMWDEMRNLRLEYEESKTKEAIFAKALDKIEVIVQRIDLWYENRENYWDRDKEKIYEILMSWADGAVEKVPELKDFLNLVKNEIAKQVEQ